MEWHKKSQLHVIEIVSALSFLCDNYIANALMEIITGLV